MIFAPVLVYRGEVHKLSKGEVTKYGPGVGIGAIDPKDLADELIVPMGELKVSIRLPAELQSADRLTFDYVDGSFVVTAN